MNNTYTSVEYTDAKAFGFDIFGDRIVFMRSSLCLLIGKMKE